VQFDLAVCACMRGVHLCVFERVYAYVCVWEGVCGRLSASACLGKLALWGLGVAV